MSARFPQPDSKDAPRERDLDRLLAGGLLDVHLQPIVDIPHGRLAACEALARPRAGSGFSNPGELFDTAAATGRLWDLEALCRQRAFARATDWPANVLLFVNCTPAVFTDARFPEVLAAEVADIPGLGTSQVVIELTERTEFDLPETLLATANAVRAEGFQLAIDDVGAGTSGLNRIMALRPQWLKLDRELVTGVDKDRVKQHMIRFISHFGRMSGVNMIAEGIETSEELEALAEIGARYGQGFHLGRPGPDMPILSPDRSRSIRRLWSQVNATRYRPPKEVLASRHMRRVLLLGADLTVGEAAKELAEKDATGAAVVEHSWLVGWCDRVEVERILADRPDAPLGFASKPVATVSRDGTTVTELLEIVSSRCECDDTKPVLVLESGEVVGVLTPGDVIRAAAEATQTLRSHGLVIASVPGRVRCDHQIRDLILRQSLETSDTAGVLGYDAAFVDIRDFNEYNWSYGHDLGDRLLRHLVGLLRNTVLRNDPEAFVGHLADDRFLLTAQRGRLEVRLRALLAHFDRSASKFCRTEANPKSQQPGEDSAAPPAIRALLVENAFRRITDGRELLDMEQRLRRIAAGREHLGAGRRVPSVLIRDREFEDVGQDSEDAQSDRAA